MFTLRELCMFVSMIDEMLPITLDNLRKTTGMDFRFKQVKPLDGILEFEINDRSICCIIEIKQEIKPYQLHLLEHYNKYYGNFMIMANCIFPKVKEELRAKRIGYLESNGNIFFNKENVFLFIDTQKSITKTKERGNRAFTKTGLKVLLHLLRNKEDINLPQRELARVNNVGLGNIPQIIDGLKETGYLLQLDNKVYVWKNRKELLDRWVFDYDLVLKPKLRKERFDYQGRWKELAFENDLTVWGGEPAANILTNQLRPERLIIYTKESRLNLMKNYRLIPETDGQIETFEMFWQQDKNQTTAPEILVYAELLLGGGKRNYEAARKIFNKYIEPML